MHEPILIQLNHAKVARVLVRCNTDTDGRRPDDVSNDTLLDLAPTVLDVHVERLEHVNLCADLPELGHVLVELDLRLWEVDSIPHPDCERADFSLDRFDSLKERSNMCLDGDQVIREGRVAHQNDVLLGSRP